MPSDAFLITTGTGLGCVGTGIGVVGFCGDGTFITSGTGIGLSGDGGTWGGAGGKASLGVCNRDWAAIAASSGDGLGADLLKKRRKKFIEENFLDTFSPFVWSASFGAAVLMRSISFSFLARTFLGRKFISCINNFYLIFLIAKPIATENLGPIS